MKRISLVAIVAVVVVLILSGFRNHSKTKKQPLVVERQECVLQFMVGNIPSEDSHIGITMDIPVDGDPVLVDSVVRMLNQVIYNFIENRYKPRFAPEKVYCADAKRLLQHYREAYQPFIVDTCYKGDEPYCLPDFFHYLTAAMVEQTEKFVTYKTSVYYVGGADFEYSTWVTFDKRDGHRLPEVISYTDFMRFLEEHPDQRTDTWNDMQYCISMGHNVGSRNSFGLKSDKVWNEYIYDPGTIDTIWYDMKVIKPYLSMEAKELLK